jgi:hypothetical protein
MSAEVDAKFLTKLSQQIPRGSRGEGEAAIRGAVETALKEANITDAADQARCRDAVLGPAEAAGWKLDGLASSLGLQATLASFATKFGGDETTLADRMTEAFSGKVKYELPERPLGLHFIAPIGITPNDGSEPGIGDFDFGEPLRYEKIMVHFHDNPDPVPRVPADPSTMGMTHMGSITRPNEQFPLEYGRGPLDLADHGYPMYLQTIRFPDGAEPPAPESVLDLIASDHQFPADYRTETRARLDLPPLESVMDLATGFRALAGKRNVKTSQLVVFADNLQTFFGIELDQAGMKDLRARLQSSTNDIAGYQALVQHYLGAPESRDLGAKGPYTLRALRQSLAAFAPEA